MDERFLRGRNLQEYQTEGSRKKWAINNFTLRGSLREISTELQLHFKHAAFVWGASFGKYVKSIYANKL